MDLFLIGHVGILGTIEISREKKDEILKRFPQALLDRIDSFEKPDISSLLGDFIPVGKEGLFGALWELKSRRSGGFLVWLDKVLLYQETIELCEYFGLNPFTLSSGYSAIVVGDIAIQKALENQGLLFCKIGQTTENNDALLIYDDKKMFLTKPKDSLENELYRCK